MYLTQAANILREHMRSNLFSYTDYISNQMDEFSEPVFEKFGIFSEAISEAFMQDCEKSIELFEKNGFKTIHAVAVLKNKDYFQEELEKKHEENLQSYYDDLIL